MDSGSASATKETLGTAGDGVPVMWALVEIFGHRKHYGRVSEVEKFGTKMLRIDVPAPPNAQPTPDGAEVFETFFYGGGSIFSVTPMTEEAARKWAAHEARYSYRPLDRLPPPTDGGPGVSFGAGAEPDPDPDPVDDDVRF